MKKLLSIILALSIALFALSFVGCNDTVDIENETESETELDESRKPTEKPTVPAAPAPATTAVTLDAVQRAAAQMRDDGKLKAVTDMFPEFGIKKLSDLKGDQLQTFGERLRAMGAKI